MLTRRSPRLSRTRFFSSLVIVVCFLSIVGAAGYGFAHPAFGWQCGVFMLCMLAIFAYHVWRFER